MAKRNKITYVNFLKFCTLHNKTFHLKIQLRMSLTPPNHIFKNKRENSL